MAPTLGLRFGSENRRLFVDPAWTSIHLELDGVVHSVPVTRGFWDDCPEVRSRAIQQWLIGHDLFPWPHRQPPRIRMVYLGGDGFRAIAPARVT
jgi:hypothetical protein